MGKISAKLRDMKLAGGAQQQQGAKPSKVRHSAGAGRDGAGSTCQGLMGRWNAGVTSSATNIGKLVGLFAVAARLALLLRRPVQRIRLQQRMP
jgi:hypothetical protein